MEPNATQPNLDTLKPIGNGVSAPVYQGGETTIISTKSADMTNSDPSIVQNVGASSENLSAKYKYPRNSQDEGITYSDQ